MQSKKSKIFLVFSYYLFVALLTGNLTAAVSSGGEDKKIEIGGAFLGIFNYLYQSNRLPESPRRQQFDFAGNIDFLWRINKKIRVNVQVQGGSGGGSLGFVGAQPEITDLNVEIDLGKYTRITLGSFDTPFGTDTPYLTNNGDTSRNTLILNTLFYSAFAGTNVGTLNTLGVKGEWTSRFGDFSVAITNGTDEAAVNGDGNFELVFSGRTAPLLGHFVAGASYIKSRDHSLSGASGTHSDFNGWLVDLVGEFGEHFFFKGYYGQLRYGDEDPSTDDRVDVWKLEGRAGFSKFYIAAKMSGWEPKPGNHLIPNPGYAIDIGDSLFYNGQKIRRYQAGFGWEFSKNMIVKTEMFYDDYYAGTPNIEDMESVDTYGVIFVCNVLLH